MLAQTRFLAETFRGYERRVQASGACDEHGLRERLITHPSSNPIREVVVTLGDWIADPSGLYLADFELLTRVPGVEAIDVVATAGLLESGFHQRIHEWLPGIEEVEAADLAEHVRAGSTDPPEGGSPYCPAGPASCRPSRIDWCSSTAIARRN